MNVSFYNKDNKGNLLLSYETSSYNNIPRIGEKVVIENKWYLIEDKLFGYGSACGTILHSEFNDVLKRFTFADGTPFGIKEE